MDHLTLSTGARIPMMGFGVFRMRDLSECEQTVYEAIRIGYRLIDTATVYKNEEAVGAAVRRAIADGICTREELFVTSKLWVTDMRDYDTAMAGINASLERLNIGYLDLYLEHQALNDYFAAWRAMQDAHRTGKLRAIGVSNFYPNILTNFCEIVEVTPAVNQIELHPYCTQEQGLMAQESAFDVMRRYGVVPEAWAPLGGGRYNPSEEEDFLAIAQAHRKTVSQVVLRWNIQRGVVVIPKSSHAERIRENFDVWDFELTQDEMATISSHDMGYSGSRAKHFEPDFVRMCLSKDSRDHIAEHGAVLTK